MSAERLIVLVRAPQEGVVKTRLAATLGAPAALEAYHRLLTTLCDQLDSLPPGAVEFRHTPDDGGMLLSPWMRRGWILEPQGSGSLGERLERATADAFSRGIQRLVIIGSDCPDLTASDVHSAWDALHSHDVVLGPAEDGGYWAIGLRTPSPEVFRYIPWSTPSVLEKTLERCRTLQLATKTLRRLRDVDTQADWEAWLHRAAPWTGPDATAGIKDPPKRCERFEGRADDCD
jgi:hypothetical protein